MVFGSVCSGIEAATMAWAPLGWKPAWYSEIDPHACAVLEHRHPDVPNLGDVTKINGADHGPIDLLVGGTPCQSFSVAGLRKGLDDDRGNLAFDFLRIAREARPRWLVWENVPGVLSSVSHPAPDPRPPELDLGGPDGPADGTEILVYDQYDADESHALSCFLAGLSELGYGFAYRILDAQFVRVDSHPRAVPQRRNRVFVVGYLGDWRPPAAVLFEPESLRGDHPPRREAGQDVAGTLAASLGVGGSSPEEAQAQHLVAHPLIGPQQRCDPELDIYVAHTLRAEGHDASEDGTGRGTPVIPFDTTQITHKENRSNPQPGDPSPSLAAHGKAPAIAFDARQSNVLIYGETAGPLDTARPQQAVGVSMRGREGGATAELSEGVTPALRASQGGGDKQHVMTGTMVRRITPLEAERLQGFPDGYTRVPYKHGKPMADGPRYRMLGDSMALNVMRWLGERIQMVEEILNG